MSRWRPQQQEGRGRGVSSQAPAVGRVEQPDDPRRYSRPLLTAALKNEDFTIKDRGICARLVGALAHIADEKIENALQNITDRAQFGIPLICKICAFCEDLNTMRVCKIFELISIFLRPELDKPLLKRAQNQVLGSFYDNVFFMDVVLQAVRDEDEENPPSISELELICSFLGKVIYFRIDASRDTVVKEIARNLHEKYGLESAIKLRAVIIDESVSSLANDTSLLAISGSNRTHGSTHVLEERIRKIVATSQERTPPGERHDNDFRNFREIAIIPTTEEILSEHRPYLPFSANQNRFIEDEEQHYLDSMFRLLRHDHVASLQDALFVSATDATATTAQSDPDLRAADALQEVGVGAPTAAATATIRENIGRPRASKLGATASFGGRSRAYRNCVIVGVSIEHVPCLMIEFDFPHEIVANPRMSKQEKVEFWSKRSLLSRDALVCVREDGHPIFLAMITTLAEELLVPPNSTATTRPMIGITCGRKEDLLRALEFMLSSPGERRALEGRANGERGGGGRGEGRDGGRGGGIGKRSEDHSAVERGRGERGAMKTKHEHGARENIPAEARREMNTVKTNLDMVVLTSGFFSCVNVLKCLQQIREIPLSEYLLPSRTNHPTLPPRNHLRTARAAETDLPAYLPNVVTVPRTTLSDVEDDTRGEDAGGAENNPIDQSSFTVPLNARNGASFVQSVTHRSSLDASQAHALHHALTNKVALIQGPPGTGKTFLGSLLARIILGIRPAVKILCICYTNHALDQFLENLLDHGVTDIVRIGGRSRSVRLEPYNINTLEQRLEKFKKSSFASRRIGALMMEKTELRQSITELQATIQCTADQIDWHDLEGYLDQVLPEVLGQFVMPAEADAGDESDADGLQGFIHQNRAMRKSDYAFRQWLKGKRAPNILTPRQRSGDIWRLDADERVGLAQRWVDQMNAPAKEELVRLFLAYQDNYEELKLMYNEKKQEVLKGARVIGATTTGAAGVKDLIDSANAQVVLVEEAGEVLEAHVVTSLSTSLQHLILIGDHLQLRPKINEYSLSVASHNGYNLDMSMFERLVVHGGRAPAMLNNQRRMRPEISRLIRHPTYPTLQDHQPSMRKRQHVRGLLQDVIFFNHNEREDATLSVSATKRNGYEARLCVEIVRLLLLNGYKSSQLVVLTPYVGQLQSINACLRTHLSAVQALVSAIDRAEMLAQGIDNDSEQDDDCAYSIAADDAFNVNADTVTGRRRAGNNGAGVDVKKDLEKRDLLRVATIDNFQGEESDIVIVSLVRSNNKGNIGFLKEPERVNVLLSRAKEGMILVGNASTYRASKKDRGRWAMVLDALEETNSVLDHIPSICQRHPRDIVQLRTPDDFRQLRPNGGCCEPCNFRMPCGHVCPQQCHVIDQAHEHVKCWRDCERSPPGCPSGHACKKPCHMVCGPCEVRVDDYISETCGHRVSAKCCEISDPERRSRIQCKKKVIEIVPYCGHEIELSCDVATRTLPEKWNCRKECSGVLKCRHKCNRACGLCHKQKKHAPDCNALCERILLCGHTCVGRKCSDHANNSCPPCALPCTQRCAHSQCPEPCSAVCSSCIEPCAWSCKHLGVCSSPCGAPCTRLPCDRRCEEYLRCGHRCPSVCGEDCPTDSSFCQECGSEGGRMVDFISGESYADVNLSKDPVIFLPCGHFYTISSMDGHMELESYYSRSKSVDARWIAPKAIAQAASGEQPKPKSCPECRAVIFGLNRYGRPMRHAELSTLELKFLSGINSTLAQMSDPIRNGSEDNAKGVRQASKARIHKYCSLFDEVLSGGPTQKIASIVQRRAVATQGDMCGAAAGATSATPLRPLTMSMSMLEVPLPPSLPLLSVAVALGNELLAAAKRRSQGSRSQQEIDKAQKYVDRLEHAISVASNGKYLKKEYDLRMTLAKYLHALCPRLEIRRNTNMPLLSSTAATTAATTAASQGISTASYSVQEYMLRMLDWCIKPEKDASDQPYQSITLDMRNDASKYRKVLIEEISNEEVAAVLKAMGSGGGYNYGGGWSEHWFQCANGHPYFIGECGGAMQRSTCPECGLIVGGEAHQLASGNTPATGLVARGAHAQVR